MPSPTPAAPGTDAASGPHAAIHWTEGVLPCSARWRSERGAAPPLRVMLADDRMTADAAYRLDAERAEKAEAELDESNAVSIRAMARAKSVEAERDALFVSHANLAAVLADINEAVGGAAGEEPSLVRAVRTLVAERDAHTALEAAHTEALDAVRGLLEGVEAVSGPAGVFSQDGRVTRARDVLAKAGRR